MHSISNRTAAAVAPSTTLRAVPLPRFAEEVQGRTSARSSPIHGGGGPAKPAEGARLALAALAAALSLAAASNDPADRLPNPTQEAHARALFRDIRCVVCQNQSIDESDADLAEDLRRIVRQQVAAGRPDAEIKHYLVQRYGPFVLERPAFNVGNAVLWGAPFAIVIVGLGALLIRRRRPLGDAAPLDAGEEARLAALSPAPPDG